MVRLTILVIFLASLAPVPLLFLASLMGAEDGDPLTKLWGVNRYNLWGQILGYFPRNICMWPLLTALVVGGMISDDRKNGTSAIYFSRPVTRMDYISMKFLSLIYGTKLVALLIELQFENTFLYVMSPYDCLAHLGQFLLGIPSNYDHPISFSVVSLILMNAASIGMLVTRVSSLEVTRE